jgi:hypothetical protein
MPKFLEPVNAVGYKYNGITGHLLSDQEYADVLGMVRENSTITNVFRQCQTLDPNEERDFIVEVPAGSSGVLAGIKVFADGFGEVNTSINAITIARDKNSYARPTISITDRFQVSAGDTVRVTVRNTSMFNQRNVYDIFVYCAFFQE